MNIWLCFIKNQSMMFQLIMVLLLFLSTPKKVVCQGTNTNGGELNFNGGNNLYTIGSANLNKNCLLTLTNSTPRTTGQVFYNRPLQFKDSVNGTAYSFSTTFVFSIEFHNGSYGGFGLAFVISPTRGFPLTFPRNYLGIFDLSNMGNPSNHIVAIELDTTFDQPLVDIDANHVGIDINSLVSDKADSARYFKDDGTPTNLSLSSGDLMQLWVEYDSKHKQLNVTLLVPKPKIPLLSLQKDLSQYLLEYMYIGFTSATGELTASHYIFDWKFKMNGTVSDINHSRLPKIPLEDQRESNSLKRILVISLSVSSAIIVIFLILGLCLFLKKKKLMEVLEDWEVQFGPHRFAYKDLHTATRGFNDTELLGKGGFGKVYKGLLPVSNIEIAVKRVSHDSRQGMREFIAEIATIGRLRHPNLVRLQGYCRHKGELYLVYDCMPKGSLHKFLYHQQPMESLDWSQRFKIIKDVSNGLCYLHEQWVQVIIHRDIKPANILLDDNMNAKLGDFGLAKLYDHGINPQTSHVAGDVFALGVVMLEITCGRKPILPRASESKMVLSDWVLECWENGDVMQVLDHKIGQDYIEKQVALVLKLGLLCSHPVAAMRPSMYNVIQYLDNVAQLPRNLLDIMNDQENKGGGEAPDSPGCSSIAPLTFTESFLSYGR